MAKVQAKVSRWRRIFDWFGRHKILAVFTVLILIAGSSYAYLALTYELRIHAERGRFENAAAKINQISRDFKQIQIADVRIINGCTHTNFGVVFGTDTISCDSRMTATYNNISSENVLSFIKEAKQILIDEGQTLAINHNNDDKSDIGSYTFNYQALSCSFDNYYYPSDGNYYLGQYHVGRTFIAEVDCGGRAQKDYFPVVKD